MYENTKLTELIKMPFFSIYMPVSVGVRCYQGIKMMKLSGIRSSNLGDLTSDIPGTGIENPSFKSTA